MSAVPWWAWLLAALLFLAGVFAWICKRAPMDTEIWPGGEPGRLTADERDYGWPPSGTDIGPWDSRSPGVHVNQWTPDGPAEQREEW